MDNLKDLREYIEKQAISIYGEDRVDVKDTSNGFEVILFFPEVRISNSKGQSHLMKEFYVRLQVEKVRKFLPDDPEVSIHIDGARGTYSLKEWISQYAHSHTRMHHLSYGWNEFCLGSSDFSIQLMDLSADIYNEDGWTVLLLSIPRFLEWESLEGTPYRHLNQIGYGFTVDKAVIQSYLPGIAEGIPHTVFGFTDQCNFIDGREDYKDYLSKVSPIKHSADYSKEKLEQLKKTAEDNILRYLDNNLIYFKGKKIIPSIYIEEEDIQDDGKIDSQIVGVYSDKIKTELKKYNINKENDQRKQQSQGKVFGEVRAVRLPKVKDNKEVKATN